jgi:MYXO-CTERM domain-containing protein
MKDLRLAKMISISTLVTSLAFVPMTLPAAAENSGASNRSDTTTNSAQTTQSTREERGFNWGWLGLIGLLGLAGRQREQPKRYRESDVSTSTNIR